MYVTVNTLHESNGQQQQEQQTASNHINGGRTGATVNKLLKVEECYWQEFDVPVFPDASDSLYYRGKLFHEL